MRVAVVDERQDVLDGRVSWLRQAGHDAVGYSFEAALAEADWFDFDAVVLDGRDDRENPMVLAGGLPDRYLGPRVAEHIRGTCGASRPRILLVSAYARTHPELSLRCQEVGVDFAFDYLDVASPALFVRAVEAPQSLTPRPPADWRTLGFAAPPRISVALAEAERSRATLPLLSDLAATVTVPPYERRRLRERLGQLLPIAVYGASNRRRYIHNNELRPILRRLLGLKPDDDSDQEVIEL